MNIHSLPLELFAVCQGPENGRTVGMVLEVKVKYCRGFQDSQPLQKGELLQLGVTSASGGQKNPTRQAGLQHSICQTSDNQGG